MPISSSARTEKTSRLDKKRRFKHCWPTSMEYKDLFSKQALDYSRFRPKYPSELFDYLAGLCAQRESAWDCGTGNGQAAVELARRFHKVFATDPSAKQISNATPLKNIEYRKTTAEDSKLADHSSDLITAAQAFHWFGHERFYAEVRRVTRGQGVLALWCYGLHKICSQVDQTILKLYQDILGNYWEKERRMVEDGYRSIAVPFEEITPPRFLMRATWSIEDLLGYLGTWSALQSYVSRNGQDPRDEIAEDLKRAWGETATREIRWDINLRVFRVNPQ
ncbi:MAG: class I SAM-dependent methyltransferase [Bdellovibrionota bacterium]